MPAALELEERVSAALKALQLEVAAPSRSHNLWNTAGAISNRRSSCRARLNSSMPAAVRKKVCFSRDRERAALVRSRISARKRAGLHRIRPFP